ncbi:hypothetical protein [Mucilaginibacter gotjawali]|uniref:Uncharacterized protein n=2 Tax=Mucilaginibacter gotjawali TaxID=1550579 RepID=A0A839SAL6_9SPHI|nr:hypothetical protein [Mucilaginibacter gotjawali]MBB3053699.1 hypothetical protein [Mucilaginibacter gotjawali]BAU53958.1 hypothetical protein MgSA37_02129 [Mucilaginibacter gotjawali]
MKKLTFTFILIIYSIAIFGQHKFTQKLANLAQITFPDTPKAIKLITGSQYQLETDSITYIIRAEKISLGPRYRFVRDIADTVYNNVAKDWVSKANGVLIYKRKALVDGWKGFEFSYKKKFAFGPEYRYYQALYLNDSLIICSMWCNDSLKKDNKDIKAFFSSFKVTLSDDDVRQDNSSEIARELGQMIGKLIAYGLMILIVVLLGLGVVFVIKKLVYK